jgi:hypothetical protein
MLCYDNANANANDNANANVNAYTNVNANANANDNDNDNANANDNDSLNMWISVFDCVMVLWNALVLADYRSVAIVLLMLVGYSDG